MQENETVELYCREFIEKKESPQFAIFLKGDWGCGKTFFVHKFLEKYDEKSEILKPNEIIYLSLFGVHSTEEIDKRMYQALHPILSSKSFQIAGALIRTALRMGVNIDFNNDKSTDTTLTFGGIDKKGTKIEVSRIKKKLIIVDDIERTQLKPSQIFGYFSEYIIDQNFKVIFIGNEDQVANKKDNGNDTDKSEFLKIKEKTIGIEFTIKPEIKVALTRFIKDLDIIEKHQNKIMETCQIVISKLQCKNLRTIRQSLYNLNIILKNLEDKVKDEHIGIVIRLFLALYIEKSMSLITEKESIEDAIIAFEKYDQNLKEYNTTMKDKDKTFGAIMLINTYIPLRKCWPEIIFDGNYSSPFLQSEYEKENTVNDSSDMKNLFKLMNNWKDMNKTEFGTLVKVIDKEMLDGVYSYPGEILHYANILFLYSKWGLIDRTEKEVLESTKFIIDQIKDKISPEIDWYMLNHSYGGWSYSDGIPELVELREYTKKISDTNLFQKIQIDLNKKISNLKDEYSTFCYDLIHPNEATNYMKIPIFSFIDVNELYNKMKDLPIEISRNILIALQERYGYKYQNGKVPEEFAPEFENLKKLKELYTQKNYDILFDPQSFFKKDIAESLEKLVEYFQKSISKKKVEVEK